MLQEWKRGDHPVPRSLEHTKLSRAKNSHNTRVMGLVSVMGILRQLMKGRVTISQRDELF